MENNQSNQLQRNLNEKLLNALDNHEFDKSLALIKSGADIPYGKDYLLLEAAKYGNLNFVKHLVESGVKVKPFGRYLINSTIELDNLKLLKYLVDNGADITVDNNVLLKFACDLDRFNIIKYLVSECNINIDSIINYEETTQKTKEWCLLYVKTKTLKDSLYIELNQNNDKIDNKSNPLKLKI